MINLNKIKNDFFYKHKMFTFNLRKKDVCYQINFIYVIGFMLLYQFMYRKAKRLQYINNVKVHQLVSNLISNITCVLFLFTHNKDLIFSYYWYDLTMMYLTLDKVMIIHHVFTLHGISHCPDYPDYDNIFSVLYIMKLADVFMHYYKILDTLQIDNRYSKFIIVFIQIITVILTGILWLIFRVFYILNMFPFKTDKTNFIVFAFIIANIYWITKLYRLVVKLNDKMLDILI